MAISLERLNCEYEAMLLGNVSTKYPLFPTGSGRVQPTRPLGSRGPVASHGAASPAAGGSDGNIRKGAEVRFGITAGDKKIFYRNELRYENPKYNPAVQKMLENPAVSKILDKPEEIREFNRKLLEKSKQTRGGGLTEKGLREAIYEFRTGKGKYIDYKEAQQLAWTLSPKKYQIGYLKGPDSTLSLSADQGTHGSRPALAEDSSRFSPSEFLKKQFPGSSSGLSRGPSASRRTLPVRPRLF